MISGKQLLPLLIGSAIGAAGWMLRVNEGGGSSDEALLERLRIAEDDLVILERENQSLRSLAQGGGTVPVPNDLIDKIEEDHGLRFLSSPVVNRIAAEELGYLIQAALESRMASYGENDYIDERQEAYQHIGWLAKGDNLMESIVAVRSVGARAWFDESSGQGWVTHRFDIKNVPDQAAMIGLLVRILLNQHSPPDVVYPGDDAEWAREAVHMGAASAAESRFYAETARSSGFLPSEEDAASQRVMKSLPSFLRGITMFPTISGRALTDTRYVAGIKEFTALVRKQPRTTYGIAFPAEKVRGEKVEISEIDEEVYFRESAGYLGLRLWLEEFAGDSDAAKIASGWMKDGYVMFEDGESSSALAWDIEVESEEFAEQLEVAMHEGVGELKKKSDVRFFGVMRVSDKKVRFVNAATQATLSKLVSK